MEARMAALNTLRIDGKEIAFREGDTLLDAALAAEIYIPSLCRHPDLPPFRDLPLADRVFHGGRVYENEPAPSAEALSGLQGCGLCSVEVEGEGEPVRACATPAAAGMKVITTGERLSILRKERLMAIMARHPHSCVTCAQREGCSLLDCSSSVPKEERCCPKFHDCELRKVAEHVGLKEETPRYRPEGLPVLDDREPDEILGYDDHGTPA